MVPSGNATPKHIKKPKDNSAEAIAVTLSTALASIMEGKDEDDDNDSNSGEDDGSITG